MQWRRPWRTPGPPQTRRYDEWVGRTERPLDVLAMVWVAGWVLPWFWTAPPVPVLRFSEATDALIWVFYVVDYGVRLRLVTGKWWFLRTHVLDLMVILVPALRVLRGIRLMVHAVRHSGNGRIVQSILLIVAIVVFFGAAFVWQAETGKPGANIETFPEALWWALVTSTTVGYGDFFPVTLAGRIGAAVLMVVGIGLVGTVSASLASWLVKRRAASDASADQRPQTLEPDERAARVAALEARLAELAENERQLRAELLSLARS